MYCEKCGMQIPDDADFCSECGEKIEIVPAKKPFFKVVAGILIVVVVLAGTWILWSHNQNNKKDDIDEEVVSTITVTPAMESVSTEEINPTVEPISTIMAEPSIEPMYTPVAELTIEPIATQSAESTLPIQEPGILPSDPSGGEPSEIIQIREWFQTTENSLSMLGKTTENGMTCYRDRDGIIKIRLEANHNAGVPIIFMERAREYFYRDGQLYFAHILPVDSDIVAGDRFYFVGNEIIRYSNIDEEDFYNGDILPKISWANDAFVEGTEVFQENN